MVDLIHESKQGLVTIVERGGLDIGENRIDQRTITEELGRNCGVGFQSKRTVVALRRVGRNQLAHPGAERRRSTHHFLRESR